MIQKLKDKTWKDETGQSIPVQYITSGNRLKELSAARLLKEAVVINKRLTAFKKQVATECEKVVKTMLDEYKAKDDYKGNITWYNFDRSIKIDVSVNERKLDSKKVMSLLKYRNKISDALFQDALNLLEGSIRRPDSKTYFRIWVKANDGSYNLIDLNFSSI